MDIIRHTKFNLVRTRHFCVRYFSGNYLPDTVLYRHFAPLLLLLGSLVSTWQVVILFIGLV